VAEDVDIPLVDLLLDLENPRLEQTASSQQDVALELARQQGDRVVKLAEDIVNKGLDPTTRTAVVATGDARKRYRVLEGNRRILAIRALETPSLVAPALTTWGNRRLTELSKKYEQNPIDPVPCVLFANEEDARHWVELRHTGANEGVGLVEWGSAEKDRYHARHAGTRRPAGQVLEFVEKHGTLSDEAKQSRARIITNVERMLETTKAREKLGLDLRDNQVVSLYPPEELAPALTHFVEDLKMKRLGVPQLYTVEDRTKYVEGLPKLPRASKRLSKPVLLDDLTAGTVSPPSAPAPRTRRRKRVVVRTTVIPSTAALNVTPPRINVVYNELLSLNAEYYPNACSVLLRVFIELTVDHYLDDRNLMTDAQIRNTNLAKRLKTVVKHLEKQGTIPAKLATAMEAYADNNRSVIGATIPTFNLYVHNQFVFPRATDLYTTWDELAPMMEKLWP
jgi:hypothetical protein